jgi:hypothetical protein
MTSSAYARRHLSLDSTRKLIESLEEIVSVIETTQGAL